MVFNLARLRLLGVLLLSISFNPIVARSAPIAQLQTDEAEQLYQIGVQQFSQGRFQQAFSTFEQVLQLFRERGDLRNEGAVLTTLGTVYLRVGQYRNALDVYQQALAIHQSIGDHSGEGKTLSNLGSVYANQGQYEQALKLYKQALAIREDLGDRAGVATIVSNLGSIYSQLGQYAQALKFYEQALAIREELGDRAGIGITLGNLGAIYNSLGRYERARQFYEQALAIREELGDYAGVGTIISNLGAIYTKLERPEQAIGFYKQALEIFGAVNDKAGAGNILDRLGLEYADQGNPSAALQFYEQALVIRQELGDRSGIGTTLNNIGQAYASAGHLDEAIEFYRQALNLRQTIGDRAGEGMTLSDLGAAYHRLGQYANAEQALFSSIGVLESLRPGLTDADKISIFETQAQTYSLLQKALVAQNKTTTALEVAERSRARAFVELLASRLSSTPDSSVEPPTIAQIQQIAQAQSATLVEYSLMGQSLYIWVVKPTGEVAFQQVDRIPANLAEVVKRSREVDGASERSQLYQLLIKPIAALLPTNPNEHVIFIPHQSLFLVSFNSLQNDQGKYLIENHTILTAPAIQVLALTRQQRQQVSGSEILIVGNPKMPQFPPEAGDLPPLFPLPEAEAEAKAIANIFSTGAITGEQATETAIAEMMPSARIIHLATHGFLDDVQGLGVPGTIALASSSEDNGFLTAGEIIEMKLGAQLAVLSACDTGRGQITGDGVIGLSRSFISAGVPSVVVSLWAIPDEPTAFLMTEFYRHLQQTGNKAQALRQAMLSTLKQHPNPTEWAAFTLIGESR